MGERSRRSGAADARPSATDLRSWGLDPAWSRTVRVAPPGRASVGWHVLDTGPGPRGTIVCVHGNPTWGYLWVGFLRRLAPGWRVIAVDQTGMGWSDRVGPRRLADRVDELVAFCRQEVDGPVVLAAHDWGGPIALGASAHLDVRAVVLGNTGVAKPEGVAVPPLIAAARRALDLVCRRTPAFVAGTARMTARSHRAALKAPYHHPDRRQAVADFVADIPLRPEDPSWVPLGRSAAALSSLAERGIPVLLVWGGRDPVFHDRFLRDLLARAPHADVHRFPAAGHLVPLDEPMADVAADWLDEVLPAGTRDEIGGSSELPGSTTDMGGVPSTPTGAATPGGDATSPAEGSPVAGPRGTTPRTSDTRPAGAVDLHGDADAVTSALVLAEPGGDARPEPSTTAAVGGGEEAFPPATDAMASAAPGAGAFRPVTAALVERADDPTTAYAGPDATCSWAELAERADRAAAQLVAAGLVPGERVTMLVEPGLDLLVAAYGVWRAGGVVVVADTGLGPRGFRRALRGATPTWVVGTRRSLLAGAVLGLTPGARRASMGGAGRALDLTAPLTGPAPALPRLRPDDPAAVVHTSGATGPAKPVRYLHGALAAQREVVRSSFAMTGDEAFTTSFAPFALLGPALGVPCVLPDIDVTRPGDLDHERFAEACGRASVGVAWLSPASAHRIVATARGREVPLRLVMLAGAPIDPDLVGAVTLVTGADVRAPYGMTEAMPVTDGTDASRRGPLGGTCTGWPLRGAEVVVVPLGEPSAGVLPAGDWGELLVAAPWMRAGYDRRWGTDHDATVERDGTTFHRTGDVGYLDADGRLFQLGRAVHVVHLPDGPVASVAAEQPVAAALGHPVAAVGVGPAGTQALVVVVDGPGRLRLADDETTSRVRAASAHPVAAVLTGPLPVDVRHRSKVDRTGLAASAGRLLAGR